MNKQPCVYVLASGKRGTLYIGVTSDVVKRVWEHKNDFVDGFSKRYNVHKLVWFELHATWSRPSCVKRRSRIGKEPGSSS